MDYWTMQKDASGGSKFSVMGARTFILSIGSLTIDGCEVLTAYAFLRPLFTVRLFSAFQHFPTQHFALTNLIINNKNSL